MFIWKCTNCGAPLELPDDARETRCSYCGLTNQVTPPQAISVPTVVRGSSQGQVGLALILGGVLMAVGVAAALGFRSASGSAAPAPAPADPARQAQLAEAEAHRLMVERVRQMMVGKNCTPLVEPTDLRGAYDLVNTLQANPSSPCVTLMAESGSRENTLKLWLNEPSGATIPTPAPSTSLHVQYCAKVTGSHPARIVPQGDQSYTFAVLECPR